MHSVFIVSVACKVRVKLEKVGDLEQPRNRFSIKSKIEINASVLSFEIVSLKQSGMLIKIPLFIM